MGFTQLSQILATQVLSVNIPENQFTQKWWVVVQSVVWNMIFFFGAQHNDINWWLRLSLTNILSNALCVTEERNAEVWTNMRTWWQIIYFWINYFCRQDWFKCFFNIKLFHMIYFRKCPWLWNAFIYNSFSTNDSRKVLKNLKQNI